MPELVRVLWGDPDHSDSRFIETWRDVSLLIGDRMHGPCVWYVYGTDNAKALVNAGCAVRLIDDDSYGRSWREHWVDQDTSRPLLVTPWINKITLLLHAMDDCGEVLYSDADVQCPVKSLTDAFSILAKRHHVQFSLFKYTKSRAVWRDQRQGLVISGACMYFRGHKGKRWLRHVRRLMQDPHTSNPRELGWHDEIIMTKAFEDSVGWFPVDEQTEEQWLATYENPCHMVIGSRSAWGKKRHLTGKRYRRDGCDFVWHRYLYSRGRIKPRDAFMERCLHHPKIVV